MITGKKGRKVVVAFCITLFSALLMLSVITACASKDTDYYLSLASEGWQTYSSNKDIPDDVHFKHDGNLYTLEISLEEGNEFTVNKIGSENKVGFSQIFSAAEDLVRGENGAVKVAHTGTYLLSYNETENTLNYNYTAKALSVTITTAVKTLYVGDKYTYKAMVSYSNGDTMEGNVTWTSSDQSVLTVDEQGEVVAVAVGKATLTASVGEFSDSIEIEVLQSNAPVSGVVLNKEKLDLELGSEEKLIATVLPEHAESKLVSWSTLDDTVATVSTDGTVTAVGYGTTKITVSTAQGGFNAVCTVTVVRHVTSMRFDAKTISLTAEGKSGTLELFCSPSDATYKDYTVEVTSGSEYISVSDNGQGILTVTPLSAGKATIEATLKENPEISAICEATVYAKGAVVVNMKQSITTMINETEDLTVSLENGEIKTVEWSASNETITVDGNGANATVTGVDFGTAVVTAKVTATNGEVYTATCSVLVSDEWYFIYGYGLGASGYWDYSYVSDKNAAERDGLLFTETERGVYTLTRYLTPENGFQIIFPKVANYTQHDDVTGEDVWNKNIPSQWVETAKYYSSSNSDAHYVTNSTTYFCVNMPGIYTVTLNLKGSGARVSIKMVSLDVSFVNLDLAQGNATLKNQEEAWFDFSVTPSNAKFSSDEVNVTLTSDYESFSNFIDYDLNFADKKLRLFVQGNPSQSFNVTLTLTIRGISTSIKLYVLSDGEEEVPVSSVTFEQEHYYVNVNQGGAEGAWQQIVKASVNQDATNQNVRYLDVTDYNVIRTQSSETRITVNAETGLVTGKVLGTATIKAVALANEAISDTCLVTFYSDVIYLIGGALSGFATNLGGWEPLDTSYKSVKGTAFEEEQLTMQSPTHFHLEYTFGNGQQFQLAFCGMDDKWVGAISMKNYLAEMSNALAGWDKEYDTTGDGKSMETKAPLTFMIDLDLSSHMAFWTVNVKNRNDFEGALLDYDASHTNLREGDMVKIKLYLLPNVEQEEILYLLDNDKNLKLTYDETTKTFTLQVQRAELSEDRDVTLTVKVKGKELSITFTVIAKHHLELQWDDNAHWMGCTDEGCDYIDGEKVAHTKTQALAANAEGHYTACSECGVQLGLQPHEYTLNDDGVFDFSNGMEKCAICGFDLFKIEGNTLVAYYGKAETVIVPEVVTIIGDHAFEGHSELKELTYSNKLTKIGSYAFAGCSALKEVKIPNLVMGIGEYAFDGTAATVSWGHNPQIITIGDRAFYGYLGSKLEIPSTVTYLGASCFAYSQIVNMVIPDNVKRSSLGGTECTFGFQGCTSLQSIVIGKGMTVLPLNFFEGCTSLETVIVRGSGFYQFKDNSFRFCTSIKAVYIERPLEELLTCNWLIMAGGTDIAGGARPMDTIKGKLYAYSAEQPGRDPFGNEYSDHFGYFRDWFAGTWHWDSSAPQTDMKVFDHIQLWEGTETITSAHIPLIVDDKRKFDAND